MKLQKFLALALCLALAACLFAGCSKQSLPVGTWKTNLDMTDLIKEEAMAGADPETAELVESMNLSDLTMELVMDLKQDGTYEMKVSEESMSAMEDKIIAGLKDALVEELAAEGYDAETLKDAGLDMDALIEDMISEEDLDMTSAAEEFQSSGKYKVEGNKLFLSDESGAYADDDYLVFTTNGNTLTVTEVSAPEGQEAENQAFVESLLPLVFNK